MDKEKFYTILTIIMVCSAIIIIGLVLQKEFLKEKHNISELPYIYGWKNMGVNAYQRGNEKAQVKILYFFDYQCIYCKELDKKLAKVFEKYSENINLKYIHLTLIDPEYSYKKSLASECARMQKTFKPFHDIIFKEQSLSDQISFEELANKVGISNKKKFLTCIKNEKAIDILNNHIAISNELNLDSVPTLIINGRIIKGAPSLKQLEYLIEQFLEDSNV